MSNYLDKWNEFLEEEDTYDDEVEKRNEESRKQGAEKMGLEEAMDPKEIKRLEQEYIRTKSNKIFNTFVKLVQAGKYDKQRLFKLKKDAKKRNMSETLQDLDEKKKKKKKKKKRDACYRKVKSRYKVWPSAYASGALVKCRKVGAKNWGNKSKKKNEGLDIDLVADQIAEMLANENKLWNWFKGGGWKQIGGKYDGKPCARQPGQKTKPKCASPAKAASMSDKEKDNAAKRKRAQDPNPDRKGKAKNVNTDPKKESVDMKITKEELNQIIFEETREVYYETFIFPYLTEASLEDGTPVCTACLYELLDEASCDCPDLVYEAEYQGRKVTLNKPTRGDVKKFKVYVKDPKTGNVKKVNFGDKKMRIKKSNPKRRKSFRARHNCDTPGPKTKARYWSCRKW